ncbi:nucleotide-binding protein [Pseudolysinimonas sp.]|uniref:MinD/ParA family ATP-binding protein n=1 Tax=Pseudolysinimonas sp. TaxID=2680009 RepID=UPI003F805A7A
MTLDRDARRPGRRAAGPVDEHAVLPTHDDLTAAVPESLTVSIALPVPVHEAPEDEQAVALDEVAVSPVVADVVAPSTTSIEIVTAELVPEPAEEGAPVDPADVPPLPEAAAPPLSRRERVRLENATARPAVPIDDTDAAPRTKPGRHAAPEGFWQRGVYEGTFHLVNPGDSARARERKATDARITKTLVGGTRFVPVLTRKGGVGKTTITTLLGMALADLRDDRVVAIDANPDRGTLAERVNRQTRSTVRDVVVHAPEIRDEASLQRHLSRDATGLDVLASDTDPLISEAFDENDYNVIADVLTQQSTGIVLTDCGTGIVHSVMRATLQRADEVVVVSGGSVDEARLASETLTWLEANGYAHLVRNGIVALNTATQGTDLVKLTEIEAHFRSRVREVVRIPYDRELAAGSVVRYAALKPFTRQAARDLAASVMDGLPAERGARVIVP